MNNMSNKMSNIKNHTHYFFDDIINIKDFDPNNINIDEKSYKNILIYYIAYVTTKNLKYVKISSVKPSHLMLNKMNGYFKETDGNMYLTLIPTNESKEKMSMENCGLKSEDLIISVTKKSDDYDEKYIKIKFYSDGELTLNKTIEIPVVITEQIFIKITNIILKSV